MNIMHMKYLTLLVPSICVSIPMEPFLFTDIKPTNYIIENNIQESKAILQYEEQKVSEDNQFWIDLHEEENTVMNDIKDNQLRIDLHEEENTAMNDIKDNQFWIDLHEEENTVMNDIKDRQFWIDFKQSLYSYDKLLEESKETGEYYDIDFDEMNRNIMEELCEEMDGIEEFCVRNTKTFELTILEKEEDPLDMGKIIKNFNSKKIPYNLIKY
jgi:hypothetical protein